MAAHLPSRPLCRARVDVVHSHNWGTYLYSVLAAGLAGVPIIHGEHGRNLNELNEINRPKSWAKRILGRRVDRLVTVSQAIATEWVARRPTEKDRVDSERRGCGALPAPAGQGGITPQLRITGARVLDRHRGAIRSDQKLRSSDRGFRAFGPAIPRKR